MTEENIATAKEEPVKEEKQKEPKKATLWRWFVSVPLPTGIVAILIILFCLWRYWWSCRTPEAILLNNTYQLVGSVGWILGREWLVYDAENKDSLAVSNVLGEFDLKDYPVGRQFVVTHPEWVIKFIGTSHEPIVADEIKVNIGGTELETGISKQSRLAQTLWLSKSLDNWARQWRDSVTLQQWEDLAMITRGADGDGETLDFDGLKAQMNAWSQNLRAKGYQLTALDIYQNLDEMDEENHLKTTLSLVWTLQSTRSSQQQLITTVLSPILIDNEDSNVNEDGHELYYWNYNSNVLPSVQ